MFECSATRKERDCVKKGAACNDCKHKMQVPCIVAKDIDHIRIYKSWDGSVEFDEEKVPLCDVDLIKVDYGDGRGYVTEWSTDPNPFGEI